MRSATASGGLAQQCGIPETALSGGRSFLGRKTGFFQLRLIHGKVEAKLVVQVAIKSAAQEEAP